MHRFIFAAVRKKTLATRWHVSSVPLDVDRSEGYTSASCSGSSCVDHCVSWCPGDIEYALVVPNLSHIGTASWVSQLHRIALMMHQFMQKLYTF